MPNSIRATDTSTVPALQRRPRSLSKAARWLLFGFGICLLLNTGANILLTLEVREEARERQEAIVAELDRRTASRQAQNTETRQALCGVLTIDLADSAHAQALARAYGCP